MFGQLTFEVIGVGPSVTDFAGGALFFNPENVGTCPCRKLNPDILMMQPAQNRTAKNVTDGPYGARYGCILL